MWSQLGSGCTTVEQHLLHRSSLTLRQGAGDKEKGCSFLPIPFSSCLQDALSAGRAEHPRRGEFYLSKAILEKKEAVSH